MKNRILYIYPTYSTFVEKDIAILNSQYPVICFQFLPQKKFLTPWYLFKELVFVIAYLPFTSMVFIQFGGYHSLIPVIFYSVFRKPSVVVLGGTDCVSFPSIGYGNLRKPILKWFTLKSLRWASLLIPPSQNLVEYEYTYQGADFPKQGYKYFDPGNHTPYEVIYNGISTDLFSPVKDIKRDNSSFLTICTNLDKRNYLLKGIDLFLELAKSFPEYHFILIGRPSSGFQINKPVNLTHIEQVPHEQLPELMSSIRFYCQLSLSEGFGLALAEAMACGCVPVVSKVGIMSEMVGESGFVLEKRDAGLLTELVKKAVKSDLEILSGKARDQVGRLFSDKNRKSRLLEIIRKILKS